MHTFELRALANGEMELSGGPLERPLKYVEKEYANRLVGFLSQLEGSVLRTFSPSGELIDEQRREPTTILPNAIGGLVGPK